MYNELDERREKLANLIFELDEFTEAELELHFKRICPTSMEIGRLQTIHDFLDDLRELGSLGYKSGKYYVQKIHPVLA